MRMSLHKGINTRNQDEFYGTGRIARNQGEFSEINV